MLDATGEETASGRPDDRLPSVLRFATELVAWVATPWALAGRSWLLAVLSVVVLIGLPTCFSTPGDKAKVLIAVPGRVTILLVLLQLAATVVTERRRWRWRWLAG